MRAGVEDVGADGGGAGGEGDEDGGWRGGAGEEDWGLDDGEGGGEDLGARGGDVGDCCGGGGGAGCGHVDGGCVRGGDEEGEEDRLAHGEGVGGCARDRCGGAQSLVGVGWNGLRARSEGWFARCEGCAMRRGVDTDDDEELEERLLARARWLLESL